MDATNITLEITTVVSVVLTVVSLLSFWFKMDKKLSLQNQKIKYLEEQNGKTELKFIALEVEMDKNTDALSKKYDSVSYSVNELKVEMEKNKGEILAAIEKLKK